MFKNNYYTNEFFKIKANFVTLRKQKLIKKR